MTSPASSTATGRGAAAVTPHHLATRAALDTVAAGGNAADAAIAANAVLGTVLPTACGIGGDLFAIVHRPGDAEPAVLNASGRGGSGLDAAALRAAGHHRMPLRQPAAITVPGCVDGWAALSERFGARPLGESLEAAVGLAEHGFEVSDELAGGLRRLEQTIAGRPSADELYPGGRAPEEGERITRRRYAASLRGIAAAGRDAFYRGAVARAIAAATDGVLTEADLEANRPDWVEPLGLDLFGMRAWTVPPNSQGYVTLAASWMLERLAPPGDPGDPRFHHAVLEAYRAAAWDRDAVAADPDASGIDPATLLAPERLEARLARLSPDRAARWPASRSDSAGTAYLCVVDRTGMGVSLIQSNFTGIGSGIPAGETGIWLHNRGAGFSLDPGDPNEAAPGKRPLHTLAPTLWTSGGDLRMLLGTRGGHQQPQYLTQVIGLLLVAGLGPGAAQASPRWNVEFDGESVGGGPFSGSSVVVEARMPEQVVAGLVGRGHRVSVGPDLPPGWGPVSVVTLDAAGTRLAAADPRVSTASAGAD